jgi:2-polyprenyl-6-methoxyphenol hydroxylase-like FAD-dependent oxidoreductase
LLHFQKVSSTNKQTKMNIIILGSSVSGCLAAVAFARKSTVKQVIIIERDDGNDQNTNSRPGIPQNQHVHSLLEGGRQAMEEIIPGFTQELIQCGGQPIQTGRDFLWLFRGARLAKYSHDSDNFIVCRRCEIDQALYQIIHREYHHKIIFINNTRVSGLLFSDDIKSTVNGVVTENGKTYYGDIVVDALGRSSLVSKWLVNAGYPQVDVLESTINLTYATQTFMVEHPEEIFIDNQNHTFYGGVWHTTTSRAQQQQQHHHPAFQGGVAFTIHNNMIMMTLGGYHKDQPLGCDSTEEFLIFAKRVHSKIFQDLLFNKILIQGKGKPIGGRPKIFSTKKQIWKRFDWMPFFPDGLLIIGDACCGLNPMFGQGMTTSAKEVLLLVQKNDNVVVPENCFQLQKSICFIPFVPFHLNVVEDLRYEMTSGYVPPLLKPASIGFDLYLKAAAYDGIIVKNMMKVMMMESSPFLLLRPDLLMRVLIWFIVGSCLCKSGSFKEMDG